MNFWERLQNYADGASILKDWVGGEAMPVEPAIAQTRAYVCVTCPHNVAGLKLTDAIAEAIRQQLELKNHLELRVQGEKSLHSCDVCQCVNRLQVWCPDKLFSRHYTRADIVRYPEFCWKRKLLAAK